MATKDCRKKPAKKQQRGGIQKVKQNVVNEYIYPARTNEADGAVSGNIDGRREWSNGNCHEIIPALLGFPVLGDICVKGKLVIPGKKKFTDALKAELNKYDPTDISIKFCGNIYTQELTRKIRILKTQGWSVIQFNGKEVPPTLPGYKVGKGENYCYPIFSHYNE